LEEVSPGSALRDCDDGEGPPVSETLVEDEEVEEDAAEALRDGERIEMWLEGIAIGASPDSWPIEEW
jgi:hypothetical protein